MMDEFLKSAFAVLVTTLICAGVVLWEYQHFKAKIAVCAIYTPELSAWDCYFSGVNIVRESKP